MDIYSIRIRGRGFLGFLKYIEIFEKFEGKVVKRVDVFYGSCLRWREIKNNFLGV